MREGPRRNVILTVAGRSARVTGIRVRLPDSLHRALKAASDREDKNLKDLLGEIARIYLLRRHPDLLKGRDGSERASGERSELRTD